MRARSPLSSQAYNRALPHPLIDTHGDTGPMLSVCLGAKVQLLIKDLLRLARGQGPHLDHFEAEWLLADVLTRSRAWLYAHADDAIEDFARQRFLELWERRCRGEPYAYLVGVREFYGRRLRVTPDVLVPRADTECLLEAALARLAPECAACVFDAGTGSGALAINVALERPFAHVIASDRSAAALRVARQNAHDLNAAVSFVQANWLLAIADSSVDLLISNPPYLSSDDLRLHGDSLAFEPLGALVAGASGLEDIEQLCVESRRVLRVGGYLLLEHGCSQGAQTRACLAAAGLVDVLTLKDLEARDRVSLARQPGDLEMSPP